MTKIQQLLKERKMTTHAFHRQLGGHRATVYRVANGTSKGTGPLRAKIAAVLGVDEGDIFNEIGMARMADQD